MEELLNFYDEYRKKVNAYDFALNILYFDRQTNMPNDGALYASEMASIISGEAFSLKTDSKCLDKIKKLYDGSSDPVLKREIFLRLRETDELTKIPKDLYIKYMKATSLGVSMWQKAKNENDYNVFKPYLIDIIKLRKEMINYIDKDVSDYDYLLDIFEEGMNTSKYDDFFNVIKEKLVPFIKNVMNNGKDINTNFLNYKFDVKKQEKFLEVVKEYLEFDDNRCFSGYSEHPFTLAISTNDLRITNHLYEDNLISAILSLIHEYGHALYYLQTNHEYEGSTLFSNGGMGVNESQSRLLENHIGRNLSFWKNVYPKLISIFDELKDVPVNDFVKAINKVQFSLIRTEADELTYPIHILIRYEIEKELFNGNINFDNLNKIWADKYEEYLGIRPENDSEGILQDMHWADGDFGYFPTYSYGSAMAAQFFHKMSNDIDVDKVLESGNFDLIKDWLLENIHKFGALKNSFDLIKDVTLEAFNPDYYINYLIDKYSKIYF